jgi:hypothetical protein
MHNSDLNQQPVSQNYPSNQPPNPLQTLKSRLGNKNATTTLPLNNQSSAPQISLDDLPKTPLTDAQKIQKINEILAEFQREMNKLRLKRNQAVEKYVQQLAWQKANQILASIKQMFSNITNRFSKK